MIDSPGENIGDHYSDAAGRWVEEQVDKRGLSYAQAWQELETNGAFEPQQDLPVDYWLTQQTYRSAA